MAMSDRRILKAMAKGTVVIEPFKRSNLSTSSYDVSLGEHFYREQKPQFSGGIYNIYDPKQVARVWGEPCTAETAATVFADSVDHYGFKPDDRVILMGPGETILAHTEEFIGGRTNITTMMKARSSLGRSFFSVCRCAGWGDVGYINRWTFEITNASRFHHVPLPVGERIAQIVFLYTGVICDKDYGQTGSYQGSTDLEEIKRLWQPANMLPRLKRDLNKD